MNPALRTMARCSLLGTMLLVIACGGSKPAPVAEAKVHLVDVTGTPVAGAVVTGSWTGVVSGTATATSDDNGDAIVTSPRSAAPGEYTFSVTDVFKPGFRYDAASNTMVQSTISR